jgi:hypothetical protein
MSRAFDYRLASHNRSAKVLMITAPAAERVFSTTCVRDGPAIHLFWVIRRRALAT